jgi:quinol monooxygenase YgiN
MVTFRANAQNQVMTVGIMPINDDPLRSVIIMREQVKSMKNAEGCLATTLSKTPIMSPDGPNEVQLIMTSRWESFESFMGWAQGKFAQDSLPQLKQFKVRMYFSEIE